MARMQLWSGLVVVLGVTVMALAGGWISPFNTKHWNSSTCNTEVCQRNCRVCCVHFHPDPTSTEYAACEATCAVLPKCPDEPPKK